MVTRDDALGQRLALTIELLGADKVFKTRQRRLRCQIEALDRIAIQQHLVNRVAGQTGRIVGVEIAAGKRKDALRQEVMQRVIDLACLSRVEKAMDHPLQQPITLL